MPNTDEKVSKFLLAINQYAEEQRQQILDEVQQYIDQELKKAESEVLNDVYHLIQKETADMRNQIRMQLSRKELEAKKLLLSHRSELTAKVFQEAEEKIRAFANSSAYESFLIQAAGQLSAVLKAEGRCIADAGSGHCKIWGCGFEGFWAGGIKGFQRHPAGRFDRGKRLPGAACG